MEPTRKTCQLCDEDFERLDSTKPSNWKTQKFCSVKCARLGNSTLFDDLGRFWPHVDKNGPLPSYDHTVGRCWIWTGALHVFGYGLFSTYRGGVRKRVLVHRLALALTGLIAGPDEVVMHLCDNPPCCNPAHLRIGTQTENIQDAHKKGRLNLDGLIIGQQMSPRGRRR